MIVINLVPEHLRKRSARDMLSSMGLDISREVLFGVGGVFAALLVLSHALLFTAQAVQMGRLALVRAQWSKLLPDKDRIDAIATELRDMRKKMSTITDITSAKNSQWSKKMNILSDAAPKGVWFKKLILDNSTLTVDGGAYSKTGGEIVTIGGFVANLKKDPAFADDFSSIEVQSIQRGRRGTTEVADFMVVAKAVPKDTAKTK